MSNSDGSSLPPASPGSRPPRRHPRNLLNDLTGRDWLRFTRSWFVHNPPRRSASQVRHPAKYPEGMVTEFIEFFTRAGEVVLDPFMGVGSTILAAEQTGRQGIGLELNPEYFALARQHLGILADQHILLNEDSGRIAEVWQERGLPMVDLVMTSPPYWNMLGQSRGNVLSAHKQRQARGLDTVYSEADPRDLGNIQGYGDFVAALAALFREASKVLRPGRYLVAVVQNLRNPEGRMVPLAWDLTRALEEFLVFKGERIWCQENKKLGIWGYPSEFVLNVHHHYCLVFRKPS